MAAAQDRNALSRAIFAACKEQGLDDDARRTKVKALTGCDSMTRCSEHQLRTVLASLNGLTGKKKALKLSARPLVRKIFAQWGELERLGALTDGSKNALRTFCANQTGALGAVKDPDHLTDAQAIKIIEALKSWIDRVKKVAI